MKLLLRLLLIASFALPILWLASVCCAHPNTTPALVRSCDCHTECSAQAERCDRESPDLRAVLLPQSDQPSNPLSAVPDAVAQAPHLTQIARAAGPPSQCQHPPSSCHTVSLPLRL